MMRTVAWAAAMAVGCLGVAGSAMGQQRAAAAGGQVVLAQRGLDPVILEELNLTRYTIQSIHAPEDNDGAWWCEVNLDGHLYTLDLRPYSLRSDHFQVLVQGPDGVLRRVEDPPIRTMKGEVRGVPGSSVRGSLTDGGVELRITFDDGSAFSLQPLRHVDPNAAFDAHVVYSEMDVVAPGGECGGGLAHPGMTEDDSPGLVMRGGATRICEIAFDADVEFYNQNGSNVTTTVNDIESIMNGVESIYEMNTGVTFEVTTIVVRTAEPDPYTTTDPGALLNQVGTTWSGGTYSPIRKDLVHLMTGKNMGGVLGIAWVSAVCTNNRYGLSRSRYTTNVTNRRAVTAHEIGHNFSADHCNGVCNPCQIMCASVGGCGAPVTSFSACEAAGIESYADNRSCLASEPASINPPFSDTFPTTTLDASKWVFNQGAQVNTSGVGEPSSPNSLQLNAAGSGLYQDDDVRSHFIMMQGVSSPILRYYAQARGVPSGGRLIVEVWTSQLRWVVKNTITSDGVDDAGFTEYTHTLSGVELHNEFRVRFRVEVDGTGQNWYVDNVFVGTNPGAPTGACCISGACTVTTEAACTGVWTSGGVCSPNPCELPTGACCYSGGMCFVLPQTQCVAEGGTFSGFGTNCSPNNCPQPTGPCCYENGLCFVLPESQCTIEGGEWQGAGGSCGVGACPEPVGACCFASGVCQSITANDCDVMGGEWQGAGAACDVGTCPVLTGACCLTETCVVVSQDDCTAQGGEFRGVNTVCGGGECSPEMGACCVGAVCVIATDDDCMAQGGSYGGPSTACNDPGNNTQPCCRADFDQNGQVQVPDIFAYLSAWFAQDESAEADGVAGIAVPDIFAYLSMWFTGCGE